MRTWDSEVASVPGAPGVMAVTSRVSVPTGICFHDAGLTRRDRGFAPPGSHVAAQSAPCECPAPAPRAQEMLESIQGLEVRGGVEPPWQAGCPHAPRPHARLRLWAEGTVSGQWESFSLVLCQVGLMPELRSRALLPSFQALVMLHSYPGGNPCTFSLLLRQIKLKRFGSH